MRIEEPMYGGANGALKIAHDMPAELLGATPRSWRRGHDRDVGPPRDDGRRGSEGMRAELPAAQWIFLESGTCASSESVSGRERELK
jgi:hypothetical protein